MDTLVGPGVAIVAIAALSMPFVLERPGLLPFAERDIELATGPRSLRVTVYATLLLIGMCLGIYASFEMGAPRRYWLAFGGLFIILLMLAILVPSGPIRRATVRLLEVHLVCAGVYLSAVLAANLVSAAFAGKVYVAYRSGGIWVDVRSSLSLFWYGVGATGLLLFAFVSLLREYFTRLWERRRASNSAMDGGVDHSAPRASHSARHRER